MAETIITRKLRQEEAGDALELALRVFLEFEAPDYGADGTAFFAASLREKEYISGLCLYGAFMGEVMPGILATRRGGTHIALLFVEKEYQRLGVGRRLIEAARAVCPDRPMTVHAAPFAVPFYRRMGFHETAPERTEHGLRFTPMELPPEEM